MESQSEKMLLLINAHGDGDLDEGRIGRITISQSPCRLGITDPSSISAADLIDPDASNRLSLLPEG